MMKQSKLHYFVTTAFLAAAFGCQADDSSPMGPELAADAVDTPELAAAATGYVARKDMPSGTRTSVATAAVTQNGTSVLYVIGGENTGHHALGRVQAYHVATNSWTWHPDLPVPLTRTNGAVTINNKIYVSGGTTGDHGEQQTLFMFDPATNRWTRKRDMPQPTTEGMSSVSNNKLYVVTSCNGEECIPPDDRPLFYRYDPVTDTWTELPPPPNVHTRGAAGFIGGKLYVTGGIGMGNPKQVDVYDPTTSQWSSESPFGSGRFSMAGLAYNAKLYLIGGYRLNSDGTATAVRATNIYDPATKRWTTGAPLPTARVDISASRVVLNGQSRIEVVGGPAPGNNLSYQP
ncbi:MAG: Kelch repeat-containing protein [Gemmatimonadales bacterium]